MQVQSKLKKDLLIFDLDGTLIDSSLDIARAANMTLKDLGYPTETAEHIKNHIGWGVVPLLKGLMPALKDEDDISIKKARDVFLAHYAEHLIIDTVFYPGVLEALRDFKAMGKTLAIVTNKPMALTERIVEELALTELFAMVVGGDTYANKKPHPEPIERVIEALGFEPSQVVFIGDSAVDVEAAKRVSLSASAGATGGVEVIGAVYGFRSAKELRGSGCEILVDSFSELACIIA